MSESYFIFSNGELKRKDNVIRITAADGRFKDIKIEVTRDIYLFGEISLNTKALNYLAQNKIPVHIFNYYGFYTGTFYPKESNVSGKLFVKQVENYTDNKKRIELAQLIGIEGSIRRIYYTTWNIIVNQEINFEKRVKRPPDNMINTMISFLNTLVYTSCLSEIYVSQLNPTISYLHSVGERRFSLSLDISEVFKPLLADRIIFSLLNKKMITEKDFVKDSNYFYMKENTQKLILKTFNERLETTIKHRDLNRKVSYRHLMRLEAYKLVKHLLEDKKYEGFKIWW